MAQITAEYAQYQSFVGNYNAYKNKIYNYFYYRCGHDKEVAEDLTSDVFIKAYENIIHYDGQYAFSTWVFAIARNTFTDHLRRSALRVNEELTEDEPDTDAEQFIDTLDQHIDIERVRVAIEQLPEMQREAVKMRYFEYLEITEIAATTGSDAGAVRKNISRGIDRLRTLLIAFLLLCNL